MYYSPDNGPNDCPGSHVDIHTRGEEAYPRIKHAGLGNPGKAKARSP